MKKFLLMLLLCCCKMLFSQDGVKLHEFYYSSIQTGFRTWTNSNIVNVAVDTSNSWVGWRRSGDVWRQDAPYVFHPRPWILDTLSYEDGLKKVTINIKLDNGGIASKYIFIRLDTESPSFRVDFIQKPKESYYNDSISFIPIFDDYERDRSNLWKLEIYFNDILDKTIFNPLNLDTICYTFPRHESENEVNLVLSDSAGNTSTVSRTFLIDEGEQYYNYPNPFNPTETSTKMVVKNFSFEDVKVYIYNAFGNLVWESIKYVNQNYYIIDWDGRYTGGNAIVPDGVYYALINNDPKKKIKIGVDR